MPDAPGSLFRDEIFDEAGASHDGGAEGTGERAHVRAIAPSVPGSDQLHADFVFEDMRRRIGTGSFDEKERFADFVRSPDGVQGRGDKFG